MPGPGAGDRRRRWRPRSASSIMTIVGLAAWRRGCLAARRRAQIVDAARCRPWNGARPATVEHINDLARLLFGLDMRHDDAKPASEHTSRSIFAVRTRTISPASTPRSDYWHSFQRHDAVLPCRETASQPATAIAFSSRRCTSSGCRRRATIDLFSFSRAKMVPIAAGITDLHGLTCSPRIVRSRRDRHPEAARSRGSR